MFEKRKLQGAQGWRSFVGLLILSAHVAIIAVFATGMRVPPPPRELPPITVDFLEQPSRLEPPTWSEPKLVSVAPPAIEAPDVPVPIEAQIHPDLTIETQPSPTPSHVATRGDTLSGDLPSLSEVAYLDPPSPSYPPASKRAREQGLVILRVVVDESGHAAHINIYRSSGHPRLDEAACDAVRQAVFKPYLDAGIPRPSVAIIPVEFSLHGSADRSRPG